MAEVRNDEWTNGDVVEAIWESTDRIVGAVDRLRKTVIIIALVPLALWLSMILLTIVGPLLFP